MKHEHQDRERAMLAKLGLSVGWARAAAIAG